MICITILPHRYQISFGSVLLAIAFMIFPSSTYAEPERRQMLCGHFLRNGLVSKIKRRTQRLIRPPTDFGAAKITSRLKRFI